MRIRKLLAMSIAAAVLGSLGIVPAQAGHDEDIHSDNVKILKRAPIEIGGDSPPAQGSDLAFQGRKLYAGSFQGTAVYKIVSKRSGFVKQIGFHACPGSQGDVSAVGDFVFVSIDSPSSNSGESAVCNNTPTTGFHESESSKGKEGIRVVDFSDPKQPKQVAFVETKCGSHTHTLLPDGAVTYLYISSYPIAQTADCNALQGHGAISILRFPTTNAAQLELVDLFDVSRSAVPNDAPIGCHDITVWPERDIAIAACLSESQVWNIANPAKPEIQARIVNEDIQIHHSSDFTWDGKMAIVSDEYAGAAGGGGCTGDKDSTVGAMWFYDVTDPTRPQLKGHYSLPRVPRPDTGEEAERFRCTTHIYSILPMRDEKKYIAVASYYSGGISVVDFTDPANPQEIGHYLQIPKGTNPDTWSSYWYNGRVYTNDFLSRLGVTVFKIKGTGKAKVRYYSGGLNPQTKIASFK